MSDWHMSWTSLREAMGLASDAASARLVVATPVHGPLIHRHCAHVVYRPGVFCWACREGQPYRVEPMGTHEARMAVVHGCMDVGLGRATVRGACARVGLRR